MNDDRTIDERIGELARELYREPPATPGAEMWSEIEARLAAEREDVAPGEAVDGASVTPITGPRRPESTSRAAPPSRHRWWIGIAAALVIGLGIGRWSTGPGAESVQVAETAVEPGVLAPSDTATPDEARGRHGSGGSAYAVATREHLAHSETFLAGVRADLGSGDEPVDLGPWARSLLGRTRLLLASPASRDPETRRLLLDLELMLAQVAQSAASSDPAEKRIVDEGLAAGDLMYRLRSATEQPAGPGTMSGQRTSSL